MNMTLQHRHLLEKVQVAAAAALGLVISYYLFWPLVRSLDPQAPLTFLPAGQWQRLGLMAVLACLMAAMTGLLTVSSRPESGILAALVALAATTLRSGPMRDLLWASPPKDYPPLFGVLSMETLTLVAVLVAMLPVARLARLLAGRLLPRWTWPDTSEAEAEMERESLRRLPGSPVMARVLSHAGLLAVEIVLAGFLLMLTFRSDDRGQVAFALAASFFVGSLAAHQLFPLRSSILLLIAPLLVGAIVFALGWSGGLASGTPPWRGAMMVAQGVPLRAAVPMDWLTLGVSGAVAGLWVSRRIHEARRYEQQEAAQ